MTNAQKRRLAGHLASAGVRAADEFTDLYGPGSPGSPENDAFNRECREVIARWLRNLPGYEWDVRLPDPGTLR